MKAIKILIVALIALVLISSCASATRVSRSGDTISIYNDAGVYKGMVKVVGLIDYKFYNNYLYTITKDMFRVQYIPTSTYMPKVTYFKSGKYYDMDMRAGSAADSVFLATSAGVKRYSLGASTVLKATYKPTYSIKTVYVSSLGMTAYASTGQVFKYKWSGSVLVPI